MFYKKSVEEELSQGLFETPTSEYRGLVTKDMAYRARYLLFTKVPYREGKIYASDGDSVSRGCRTGKGNLLVAYDISLYEKGYLKAYKQIDKEAEALVKSGASNFYG